MSSKQKTNLKEEEQHKLINMYTRALTSLAQNTGKLVEQLQKTQQKENYKVINDITNAVVSFYSDDLRAIMQSNYQTWVDSDVSLHNIVKGSMAGENAVNTAKKLEGNISSAIQEMFSNRPVPLSVPDANPNIEPEKLASMEEKINKYISNITEIQNSMIAKIDKAADENQLFNCIRGHVDATYEGALQGFIVRASGVNGITENLRNNMKQQEAKLSALNQSIAKTSASAGASMDSFPNIDFF